MTDVKVFRMENERQGCPVRPLTERRRVKPVCPIVDG